MKNLFFFIPLIFLLIMGTISSSQNLPSEYYKVINKNSLYVFSSDTHILFFSSPGLTGNFSYLSNIPGNFSSSTNITFNDGSFIIKNNDTIFLYDIHNIYHPSLLSSNSWGDAIQQVYGFGPFFVVKVSNLLKLLEITNNSLEIKEDTLLQLTNQPLLKYPYIIIRRNIYKYVENFGSYQVFYMDHDGDSGMLFEFLTEDQLIYTTEVYSPPPLPPSICGIRSRLLQEPDFPFVFINDWWADCLPEYIYEYYAGSKRYIYLLDWRLPPNGGRIVVNLSGVTLYQHFSWDYELKLTDEHLFQLGDSIFYSNPNAPAVFYNLEYTITSMEDIKTVPTSYTLGTNYPNPFNPITRIEYTISKLSYVKIIVTDILGKKIAILVNEEKPAGKFTCLFDGSSITSGIYIYTLTVDNYTESKKMVLLK